MIREKIKSFIKREIGWGEVVLIIAIVCLIIWGQIQRYELSSNAVFAKGVIVRINKGSKGSLYWHFIFYANGQEIESSMPFDNKYEIGDSITIKYQADNPYNNTLVK